MTAIRKPWTPAENAALVHLYFAMLDAEHEGQPYNKAAMIRCARGENVLTEESLGLPLAGFRYGGRLHQRSRGSIEAKLMNATACHRDLVPTAETMDSHGYRALPNYQASLREAMAAYITGTIQGWLEVQEQRA